MTPSGRQPHPSAVTIRCREHGPLVVELPTGEAWQGLAIRVTDHLGREFPLPREKPLLALCRCGQSGRRPFCDGTHARTGFRAPELAPQPTRETAVEPGESTAISPAAGPASEPVATANSIAERLTGEPVTTTDPQEKPAPDDGNDMDWGSAPL